MFEATTQTVQKKRRNPVGVIVSVLLHILLIAVVIILAKEAVEEDDAVEVEVTFFESAPPPPPPPPPPPAASKPSTAPKSEVVKPTEIVQPEEVEELPDNEELQEAEEVEAVDYGVSGGVEGGVIGGVEGGVVGGTGDPANWNGGVLDLGYDAEKMVWIERPSPTYPPLAKKNGIEGEVVLEVVFGLDGVPEEIKVVAGPKVFHTEAIKAVEQWRCEPVKSGNVLTKVRMKIRLKFALSG